MRYKTDSQKNFVCHLMKRSICYVFFVKVIDCMISIKKNINAVILGVLLKAVVVGE